MKKLLAAVTSIAMSSSLVTSAFATSVTVSAAGGSPAVQPNVSMGEVMDGAVNKIAGQSDDFLVSQINSGKTADKDQYGTDKVNDKFIVKGKEYKVKPGDDIEVTFEVETGDSYVSAIRAELKDLPAGITAELKDPACYADPDMHKWMLYNGYSYQIKTTSTIGSHPAKFLDKDTSDEYNNDVMQLVLHIPEDIAPGEYEYDFKFFEVTEYGQKTAEHDISMFNAVTVPGKLIVEGNASGTTTVAPTTTEKVPTTTAKAPTTTAKAPTTTEKAPTTTKPKDEYGTDVVNDKFIVRGKEYKVKPGDDIEVTFEVETGDSYVSAIRAELKDLPAGITAELKDPTCYADPDMHKWVLYNGFSYQIKTTSTIGSHPAKFLDKDTSDEYNNDVMQLMLHIPEDIAPGEYEYDFDLFEVTEYGQKTAEHDISMFNAVTVPGKLIVEGDAPATTTAPVTTAKSTESTKVTPATTVTPVTTDKAPVTTTPVKPAEGKAEWLIPEVKAKPGDTVEMKVIVNGASDLAVAGASYTVTADSPIEFSGVSGQSDAYASAIVNNAETNEFAFGENKGAGITASDKAVIMTLTYKVPEGTADGRYPVKWSDAFVSDTNGLEITSDVTLTDGAIIVENEKFDGSIEWDIPDKVKAKPGETVKMEVVVNDPDGAGLPVAGAQFAIDAESPIEFSTVDDKSAAYGADIVNNTSTNEFAFGEGKGAGVAAKNGDNVIVLTYTVPEGTPGGEYAVNWGGDIYISDTNGNPLTEQIKLSNGSILVEEEKFDGEIAWEIPTVHAKPGETVTMEVEVKDPDNAALPVAGAQFAIDAKTPIEFSGVSDTSAGYAASIVNNAETNEFAFGEGKGAGVAAKNGDNVLVLTYTVPNGTPAGKYDVTWGGDVYISDTNGNALTEQISLIDGAIIVDDVTVEGDLTWTIPEVEAQPGETVTMDVIVTVGEKNLPVAGAQFGISAKSPIGFGGVSGTSEGYAASIVNNPETNEFAFGHGKGEGIEAADKSKVLTLTYTVPKDAQPGRYDVTWSDAFISDTNGNEITSSVKLVDGAIIIPEKKATTTAPVTTEKAPVTTESATTEKAPVTTVAPTTTKAPVTTVATTTATPVTAPDGKILWVIDEVDAAPGDEVKLNVVVNDSNGANLPIGGAQYIITETTPIDFVSASEKSEGYGADIVYNAETKEFAFANEKGAGVAAANGAVVMTLTYKVPEDCEEGRYPVTFGDKSFFNISSADGVDMSSQILTMDGAINVKKPVTTTEAPVTTVTETATITKPVTTTEPVTTTAPPIAEGSVIWQGETVKAKPGEKVELSFIVSDPKDSKLPLGGANFIISADGGIKLVDGTGSEGYGADIVYNEETKEFAFAHAKGTGVAAPDGSKVITLTFDVPADIEPGKYPVTLSDLFASDTNGYDITKNILVMNGAIEVELPVTTAEPVTTASTPTTTATTPTTTAPPVTTQIADGAVIWQLDEAEGKPGETVTLTMTVLDPNDTKLAIGGGQFVIVTDPDLVAAAGTPYGAVLVYNPETNEFAFADADGNGVPSADGTKMLTIDFTIPEDAVPGTEYPVEISEIVAINGDGDDVTKSVFGANGKIKVIAPDVTTTEPTPTTTGSTPTTTAEPVPTTTGSTPTTTAEPVPTTTGSTPTTSAEPVTTDTTPTTSAKPVTTDTTPTTTKFVAPGSETVTTAPTTTNPTLIVPNPNVSVTVIDGFYFNHDPKPFKTGHITSIEMTDTEGNPMTPDESLFRFEEVNSKADNPQDAYVESNTSFTYTVNVYYGDVQLIDTATGKPVQFTAYIGVKGDANLDNLADAKDASKVLTYYSKISTGANRDETMMNDPEKDERFKENPTLDQFTAFLADVDKDVYSLNNWKTLKSGREIMSNDASWILKYYSQRSTGVDDAHEAWNTTFSSKETEKSRAYLFDQYVTLDKFIDDQIKE